MKRLSMSIVILTNQDASAFLFHTGIRSYFTMNIDAIPEAPRYWLVPRGVDNPSFDETFASFDGCEITKHTLLDFPNLYWDNRPGLMHHRFVTDHEVSRQEIYEVSC